MRETEENYENLRLYCVPARIRNGSFKDANQAPMLEPAYLLSLVSVHACMQLPIRHCLCVLCFRKYIYIYIYIYIYTETVATLHWQTIHSVHYHGRLSRISYFRWRYRYPEVNTPPRIVRFAHYEVHIVPLGYSLALP